MGEPGLHKPLLTLYGHRESIRCVAFSPDGSTIASGSADQTIKFWDARDGKLLATVERQYKSNMLADYTNSVSFNPDGDTIVVASCRGTIRVYDVHTYQRLHMYRDQDFALKAAFSPDGRDICTLWGSSLKIYTWKGGAKPPRRIDRSPIILSNMQQQKSLTGSIDYRPDGGAIIADMGAFPPRVSLINTVDMKVLYSLDASEEIRHVFCTAFSPDGKTIATGSSEATVNVWNACTGARIAILEKFWRNNDTPAAGYAGSVRFSPDGTRIAAGLLHGVIKEWRWPGGKPVRAIWAHQAPVNCIPPSRGSAIIAYSPDGTSMVSGGIDGVVRVWRLADCPELDP